MKDAVLLLKEEALKETKRMANNGDKVAKAIIEGLEAGSEKAQEYFSAIVAQMFVDLSK